MNISIPANNQSSWSSASTLPQILNQWAYYSNSYPKQWFTWYVWNPVSISYSQTTVASYTKTIADNSVVETVWWTAINWYFKNLVDSFQLLGNFYTNVDYWTATELTIWYNAFGTALGSATYNLSNTVRFASIERLAAGKTIWSIFSFQPVFKCSYDNSNWSITVSNLIVTAVLKLMSTSGTLTTIWTMTSSALATTSQATNTIRYAFWPVIYSSFTPQTSSLWDRIIIEITLSWTITSVWTTSTGGATSVTLSLWFGYDWSKRQVASDYLAHKPFQVEIA